MHSFIVLCAVRSTCTYDSYYELDISFKQREGTSLFCSLSAASKQFSYCHRNVYTYVRTVTDAGLGPFQVLVLLKSANISSASLNTYSSCCCRVIEPGNEMYWARLMKRSEMKWSLFLPNLFCLCVCVSVSVCPGKKIKQHQIYW